MARAVQNYDLTEAPPEADCLEGFAHPRMSAQLFGHIEAQQKIKNALYGTRMHHAWLLTGPEGIGKATLAYHVAKMIFSYPDAASLPLQEEPILPYKGELASQVEARSYPDLITLSRRWDQKSKKFKTGIDIENIRDLNRQLSVTRGRDNWRIALIDSADDMNNNAANALLKSLEEPPKKTLFFLLSNNPGSLLPTIRSRCFHLPLKALSPQNVEHAMRAALVQADMSDILQNPDGITKAAKLSQGSVRRGLNLLVGKGVEINSILEKIFAQLPKLDHGLVYDQAERLSPAAAEADFEMFFSLLCDMLHRHIKNAALKGEYNLALWAELWETVLRLKNEAKTYNLDKKNLILQIFSQLQSVAAKTI